MSSIRSIKETVKVITITKQLQKINFQIRHPENAFAIIGIAITCDKISENTRRRFPKGNKVGYLALSISQKGDIAFVEDVKVDNNDYSDFFSHSVLGLSPLMDWAQKRDFYFQTFFKISESILEGFFEDEYAPSLTDEKGNVLPHLYKIHIYIRYQLKSLINKEH